MGCTKEKKTTTAGTSPAVPRSARRLVDAPDARCHPLHALILRKGISLAEAARLLGWSVRKLMLVIHEWHRPRDAEPIATELGWDPEQLFPRQ